MGLSLSALGSLFEDNIPQVELLALLPLETQGRVIARLSTKNRETYFGVLTNNDLSNILGTLSPQEIRSLLHNMEKGRRKAILRKLHLSKRSHVELLLSFEPESAGGIMDVDFIEVAPKNTIGNVISAIQDKDVANRKHAIIMQTAKHIQYVPLRKLITSAVQNHVASIAEPLPCINTSTDQEDILNELDKSNTDMVGVVDDDNKLLGVIHVSDLIDIASVEATEDIYKFAGVSPTESIHDTFIQKVKRRCPWLVINLFTAFLASFVISLFSESIAQMAILASLMPIVAGEGGNAATQSLAVAVRGLSTGVVDTRTGITLVIREALAGIINGILVGIVGAIIAYFMNANILLGGILAAAMTINLFVAGMVGAFVPLILKKLGIDPAVASSVFVTTATDIVGFLSFLGLATLLLL